nr:hypothetical protein [Bacteroidia bacterium]
MITSRPAKSQDTKEFFIYFSCAVLTTTFLFFIDEGYYNFKWMDSIGNWVAFMIYVVGFLLGVAFTHEIILRMYKGKNKVLYSALIGIPAGLLFVLGFFRLI